MALQDFLIPGEEVKFSSSNSLSYGGKRYKILLTDRRLLLYANRGVIIRNDDVVSVKLTELQGVKYRETGVFMRTGILELQGKTLMQLSGAPAQAKTLYQQVLQFL